MAKQFIQLTANSTGGTRQEMLEGKPHTVVPMAMLTEGVHIGMGGKKLFYPADQLATLTAAWNGRPVLVNHPSGKAAGDPEVFNAQKIGTIMNTRWDAGAKKLRAEAWIENERAAKVDPRVSQAMVSGTMMELSTGLFVKDPVVESGVWNGEEYEAIAKDYVPDHLAVLPDSKGACSCADGAGFLRMNQAGEETAIHFENVDGILKLVTNEQSNETIRNLLTDAIQEKYPPASNDGYHVWVEATYDKFFIYERGTELYRQDYEISSDDSTVTLTGEPVKVVRVTEYRTKSGEFIGNMDVQDTGEPSMDKKKMVTSLIENSQTKWTEEHRDLLLGMDKEVLMNMEPEPVEEPKPEDKEEPTQNRSFAELLADASPEDQAVWNESKQIRDDMRNKLIEGIIANKNCDFERADLLQMNTQQLQKMAKMAGVEEKQPTYIGNAEPGASPDVDLNGVEGIPETNVASILNERKA